MDPDRLTALISTLQKAVGLLNAQKYDAIKQGVLNLCNLIARPTLRITVFGPFNYGKSTLLNALLGEKTLPIDLVPTTGAAITVKYGPNLHSRITLTDGSIVEAPGSDLLKQYAILDQQRRMREDVIEVEVQCPHPFLQTGVELMDLPGTDDLEAQNDQVQAKLLEADLVIQLLDARKLMALAEREHLRDWLLDRGINTVLFVVNFLNLMEPDDRKQVSYRLRFLAESFRADLPDGVSNLYPVDALPALRARLKGDMAAATQTGLSALESALQTIVQTQRPRLALQRLPRLMVLATQVQSTLKIQIQTLDSAPSAEDLRCVEILQEAQQLIQQGFRTSVIDLRQWLSTPNLLPQFQDSLANALQANQASHWLDQILKPAWREKRQAVVDWVYKACDFFERPRPVDLWVALETPLGEPQTAAASDSDSETTRRSNEEVAPVAIATGLGWVLGGPMGAAVLGSTSYLVNQAGGKRTSKAPQPNPTQSKQISLSTAQTYLRHFSEAALAALETYETAANQVIQEKITPPEPAPSAQHEAQLELLSNTLAELTQAIEGCDLTSVLE
ncbi:MAG: dynamin family protein [Pseudanabaenales cyanobacterium]|nr:dynamin family protein [Pseudanabaenales cyanobacterium]